MSERATEQSVPAEIAAAFGVEPSTLERLPGGHINLTFRAQRSDGTSCILQRVNPIFPAVVNRDIAAVAAHLTAKGLTSPVPILTTAGAPWLESDAGVWRALSFVAGTTTETVGSAAEARAAGTLLGQFHAALADFDYEFQSVRSDPHDTPRHLATLENSLAEHGSHRHFAAVAPVAQAILAAARDLTALPTAPARVVHGDPKISNLLFDAVSGEGVCLVDLDTLGRRSVAVELGDAFRSWCNPAGEEAADARFDMPLFAAAVGGYAAGSGRLLTAAERQAIPAAVHAIGVELAARFCADALNERFFGWDRMRFADASAHNLARARAQLRIGLDAFAARDAMLEIIDAAFARHGP